MRIFLVVLLAACAAFPPPALGRQTAPPPTPETVLTKLEKAHPRLILREKDLAALRPVLDGDALAKSIQQAVLRGADAMVGKGAVQYEKIGPRLLHVSRAMVKLGARDRAQLVVIAYQSGLVR